MNYVFDLDGTICSNTNGDYVNAVPFAERIKKINKLYYEGNNVVIFTARGMGSSNNNQIEAINRYFSFTEKQLIDWGVKYNNLILGKPQADIYIDDKGISDEQFFSNTRNTL